MTVSYRKRFADVVIFNVFHLSMSPFVIGALAGSFTLVTWLNWSSAVTATAPLDARVSLFSALELFCLILALPLLLGIAPVANLGRLNKDPGSDITVSLAPESIVSESQLNRSEIRWQAVRKLSRTPWHIIIYPVTDDAIVIARRAFETDKIGDSFWRELQARRKAA